uniref:Ig-like domain-containing protein n=1 Tax=Poecilia reticulata TaxID=8081 RepID=A0A3P9PPJ0_POERE
KPTLYHIHLSGAVLSILVFADLHVTIVQRIKTVSVLESENCTFECLLSHELDDEPIWTINGQVVVTNSHIQLVHNSRIYKMGIRDVVLSDAGDVVFTIKDLSCRTMLFVKGEQLCLINMCLFCQFEADSKMLSIFPPLEKPVHIFRDLLNVKAVPGEDAELSCEITKPEVTIRWLKNGHPIRQSPKYEMKKGECTLVVKNLNNSDSGVYTCEVANKFGVTSYNGNITVKTGPGVCGMSTEALYGVTLCRATPLWLSCPG